MKYEKVIIVAKEATEYIKKLLTVGDELFGEDNTICYTAEFDNGVEMDIKLCGVQYESGSNNTCWTEAVLFSENGSELCCTEPSDGFFGEWQLEYDGDTYIAIIKENKIKINCDESFLGKDIKEYALNSEDFHAQLLKDKYYSGDCKYPPKDDVYYEIEYMSSYDCFKEHCNPNKEGIYLIRDSIKSPKRERR